jgi:hypothetical protein
VVLLRKWECEMAHVFVFRILFKGTKRRHITLYILYENWRWFLHCFYICKFHLSSQILERKMIGLKTSFTRANCTWST